MICMVELIPTCDMCRYSKPDYEYYIDKSGKIKLRVFQKSEFVRCDKVKEIIYNKNCEEPVRVNKYFAYICPFFTHKYRGQVWMGEQYTQDVIDVEELENAEYLEHQ